MKPYEVQYRAPQGSCLGPLLFLIFTNDLHLQLEYCKCILFADDTTLYYSHRLKQYREWCIQEDLCKLYDWFSTNKLTLNIAKSVCMQFRKMKELNPKIRIDNESLPVVTHTKFLGIWIDSSLSWQQHFNQLCLKIIQNTNLLKVSCNHLNITTKKLIYNAHIYSHLVYGITTWGNMLRSKQLQKLQKLQNKCLALITGNRISTKEYQSQKIMKIPKIIQLQNLKLGFRVHHSQLLIMILSACTTDAHSQQLLKSHKYSTRCKNEPNHHRLTSLWYKNSFMTKSIVEFQSLPLAI